MKFNVKHIAITCALLAGGLSMASTAQAAQLRLADTALPTLSYSMPKDMVMSQSTDQLVKTAQKKSKRITSAKAKSIARNHVGNVKYVINVIPRGDVFIVRVEKHGGVIVDVMVDAATGRVR